MEESRHSLNNKDRTEVHAGIISHQWTVMAEDNAFLLRRVQELETDLARLRVEWLHLQMLARYAEDNPQGYWRHMEWRRCGCGNKPFLDGKQCVSCKAKLLREQLRDARAGVQKVEASEEFFHSE
jgi:hypothetical protein